MMPTPTTSSTIGPQSQTWIGGGASTMGWLSMKNMWARQIGPELSLSIGAFDAKVIPVTFSSTPTGPGQGVHYPTAESTPWKSSCTSSTSYPRTTTHPAHQRQDQIGSAQDQEAAILINTSRGGVPRDTLTLLRIARVSVSNAPTGV
ncbi:hypothetical protein EHS25_000942 [Saitozyma podzolica]|uniref:Uncharacterized protein n=1 Tax=Saitozyma podzolica TaxID=1890683 RepID=A0A427YXP5_9TREE|nr:hypothetical protein EHS25_000942 [Saitozyma podzolica]